MKEFSFKKTVSNKLCSLNQYFSSLEITRPIINTQVFKSLTYPLGLSLFALYSTAFHKINNYHF